MTTVNITDDRYLSVTTRRDYAGNKLVHPDFGEENRVFDLHNGGIITLESLFVGNRV